MSLSDSPSHLSPPPKPIEHPFENASPATSSSTSDVDHDDDFLYQWAAVLINDAIHTRSRSLASSLPLRPSERHILWWFRASHNPWVRRFVFLVILLMLLVGFFESPARGVYGPLSPGLSDLLEFLCLAVVSLDTLAKMLWMRPSTFFKDKWNVLKVLILCVYFADLFVSYLLIAFDVVGLRVSRFLRIYFLLEKSRRLRAMVQNVGKTFGSIFTLLCFIVLVVVFWALLGYYLFFASPEGLSYFPSFGQAFVSLFILATTANFPDVMMPAYSRDPASSLYFIVFLLFVLYFLLNALTATVYNAYRTGTRADVLRGLATREKALSAAFRALQIDGAVSFSAWQRVMVYARSDLDPYLTGVIFNIVDQRGRGGLGKEDFMSICDFIDLKFSRDLTQSFQGYFEGPLQRVCRYLAHARPFHWLCSLMLLANGCLAIAETYACSLQICAPYIYVEWSFLGYFWIDFAVRLLGTGLWQFWIRPWNIFDVVTLLGWTVGIIIENSLSAAVPALRYVLVLQTLRLLRLLSTNNEFQVIANTFLALVPHMLYYLALLFCIFYDFALLGEELFYGKLNLPNPVLSQMAYGQNDYWANNFNSMGSTFVTLFELMVVNNWFVIMEAVVAVTSYWSRLYFMAFFIVTVVVVLNLIIAFVIEAFVTAVDHSKSALALQARLDSLLHAAQARMPGPHPALQVKPSTRLFKLYVDIFKDPAQAPAPPQQPQAGYEVLGDDQFHHVEQHATGEKIVDGFLQSDEDDDHDIEFDANLPLLAEARQSVERNPSPISSSPIHSSSQPRIDTSSHPLFNNTSFYDSASSQNVSILQQSQQFSSMTRLLSFDES